MSNSETSGCSEEPIADRLSSKTLLCIQNDIVFHVTRDKRVLWHHYDAHLARHTPAGIKEHAHLQEHLPNTAYRQLSPEVDAFFKRETGADSNDTLITHNAMIECDVIHFGLAAEPDKHYQVRMLSDRAGGLLLLLNDITLEKQNEAHLSQSIKQLAVFNKTLTDLNQQLNTIKGREQLYHLVVKSACQAMEADSASLWTLDQDWLALEVESAANKKSAGKRQIKKADHPGFFDNLSNSRVHTVQIAKDHKHYQQVTRSALDAPIWFEGCVIGLLRVEFFDHQHGWSDNEQSFVASLADYSAQVQEKLIKDEAQSALRLSETRFEVLTQNSDAAIFAFEDTFLYANPALEYLTGVDIDVLKGSDITTIFNKHFWLVHKQAAADAANSNHAKSLKQEIEITTPSGEKHWLFVTSTRSNFDNQDCWLASAFDITERKTSEARMKFQAHHDQLTGLPNRVRFHERLSASLARTSRDRFYRFTVLFINIDRFKVFNDSMGQLLGDQLLLELSKRIRLCLSTNDMTARVSGDEFAVFLDGIYDIDEVRMAISSMQNAIAEPFKFEQQETVCTASIGIVICDHSYIKAEHIMRDASIAMYHAKDDGKASFRFYSPEMHHRAKRILETENELRLAIRQQTLELYYQPIISLNTHQTAYCEALIRWHKNSDTIISPLDFIPLAEESGAILSLGTWIVDRATTQISEWHQQGWTDMGVSINVSGKQFKAAAISDNVKDAIERHQLPPESLKIEITETSMIQNSDTIQEQLTSLRELGCELLVDDFGTGYSSLSYLHQFPITCIKIDRSFIATLSSDEESQEIVKAITNLAHNLRLSVVAEGVETEKQANILKNIGCDYAQGFYYSPPLPAADAVKFFGSIEDQVSVPRQSRRVEKNYEETSD